MFNETRAKSKFERQDGVVFQKDLGENTADVVPTMSTFDPDSSWVAVTEPSDT